MHTNRFSTHDDRYLITSYGNGWAYEVHCQSTGCSFWVQDHDAEDLHHASQKFAFTGVLDEYMDTLGE